MTLCIYHGNCADGGGGHKHASGFRIPFDQLEQFVA